MKATELMIGDWVQSPESGKYFKVETIYGGNNEAMHCISAKTDDGEFCNKGIWQPIPLTPEILEKNGFVNQDGDEYKLFVADAESYYFGFYSVRYYFSLKLLCVVKDNKNGAQSEVKGQYTYVHELQNALQLCGIEKAIEL